MATKTDKVLDLPFERVALLLQGGGALGSYQCGVFQALDEAGIRPNCVSGISIGAINAALIAGNAPEDRQQALTSFWEQVTKPPFGSPFYRPMLDHFSRYGDQIHGYMNQAHAMANVAGGAPGFFTPRRILPFFSPSGTPAAESFYDTSPLRDTLVDLVDFDRINSGEIWFSVGAVNVRTGNFEFFDNSQRVIRPEHIMASGALPPGFPAVEVDGELYWDGGLVSNTPLDWVLAPDARADTLAFQVDLWRAQGEVPKSVMDLDLRQKDIRFSSRTRNSTSSFRSMQRARRALHRLLEHVPDHSVLSDEDCALLNEVADEKVYNIVHIIYRAKVYEGSAKDCEFSRSTMESHWASGLEDARRALRHHQILERPTSADGVAIYDY